MSRMNSKGALALILSKCIRIGPLYIFKLSRKERLQVEVAAEPGKRSLLTLEERRLLRGPRKSPPRGAARLGVEGGEQ